ncbi:hypothetical protein FQR65_LT16014 [Abscondita terminalis]|nr:hypothetical protein FQR65_LT16014 [Abscondita terminalis]
MSQLEEDVKNYIKFKYSGGPVHIKSDVVPHIFHCQLSRKRTFPATERTTYIKRARQQLVEVIISAPELVPESENVERSPLIRSPTEVESLKSEAQAAQGIITTLTKIAIEWSTYIATHKNKMYMGLPGDSLYLIDLLLESIKTTRALKKIRLNPSFQQLAADFGITPSAASKAFNKTIDPLAKCLKEDFLENQKNEADCLSVSI